MSAFDERRRQDLASLHALQRKYPSVLQVAETSGPPVHWVRLWVTVPTAADNRFPSWQRASTSVVLTLPARYPFEPPTVTVEQPMWNPNVFPCGILCWGKQWQPGWSLADLAWRIVRIIALDPAIINYTEPARTETAVWYLENLHSGWFPTVKLGEREVPSDRGLVFRNLGVA